MRTRPLKIAAAFVSVPLSLHLGALLGTLSNQLVLALLPSLLTVCLLPVFSALWAHGVAKPPIRTFSVMILMQCMAMGLAVWAQVHILSLARVGVLSLLDAGMLLWVARWLLPREAP